MKMYLLEKKSKEEISKLFSTGSYPSANKMSREDAISKHVPVYINMDFKHVIGKEEYGFAVLDVSVHKVFDEGSLPVDLIYDVTLWTGCELIRIKLCQQEYHDGKWLKQLSVPSTSFVSKKDYLLLIKSIHPRESEQFYFNTVGIHRLNNKYYYATSNCTITAKGINRNIQAIQEGFNLNLGIDDKELKHIKITTIEKFIKFNQLHYDVFFPIHCIPILAVLRYFLKISRFSPGAVLWIDGNVGSGKTQLSITMGDFFNRGNSQNLLSHLSTPKAKYNDICSKLIKYRNAVFILDDVKKEETYRNRTNSKNITDLVVRSVYMGKVDSAVNGRDSVDAAAIVTGEFFKEQMSTVSRMIYLQIDDFLNTGNNSSDFKKIQDDCYYLARFMVFFLQWLLDKMESQQEKENLFSILEDLKQNEQLKDKFSGKKTGSRMAETVAIFQLVSRVLGLFFNDSGISGNIISDFLADSQRTLLDLGYATYLKTINYNTIFMDSLKMILTDLKIKDCRYGNGYLQLAKNIEENISYWKDNLDNDNPRFSKPHTPCINELSRETELNYFGKLYLFGLQEGYDGILYKRNRQESLLVKEDIACNLIRNKIMSQMKSLHFKLYESEYSNDNIVTMLLESHAIYGYKRKDGFGRIISFPIFAINENANDERYIEKTGNCRMLKINTEAIKCSALSAEPLIQLKPFQEKAIKYKEDRRHGHVHYARLAKDLSNALNEMDRFIDLK